MWQPSVFPTRERFGVALNPGQLITSLSNIAEGVSWYNYGVKKVPNKKIIKDILIWLESNGMVTAVSNRLGTFIFIINWDIYNTIDEEKVTQNNQEVETIKKRLVDTLKELKEVKKKLKKKSKEKDLKTYCANFELFWNAFTDKRSREPALKSWNQIPDLTEELCEKIIEGAKRYAVERKNILARGSTPKMAQGWLTDRRWEDEIIPQPPKPLTEAEKKERLFQAFLQDEAQNESTGSGPQDVIDIENSSETINPTVSALPGGRTDD